MTSLFMLILFAYCHILPHLVSAKASVSSRGLTRPQFRFKKTIESDLPTICSLLASATLKQTQDEGIFDWVRKIEFLRVKESFHKQLSSRFRAMKQGHAVIQKQHDMASLIYKKDPNTPDPTELSRLLFSNDSFRWALENAVNCATEENNAWVNHNFAIAPEDPALLQHFMMSAFMDKNLVGFCEVAMLPSPKEVDNIDRYYPCIVNLGKSSLQYSREKKMLNKYIQFTQLLYPY